MADTKSREELLLRIKELEDEVTKLNLTIRKDSDIKYGLRWINVPEAFEKESENKIPILEEIKEKAIKNNDGKPTNIMIEGDNYHALKCLNYTHKGKIDAIYIDPPYNTEAGFVYRDKRVMDKFPDGEKIDINHPLRHSAWLSFMEKRLSLAYELLSKNGVIFISIDDNEYSNLKLLCDKIFKEKNYCGELIWHKKYGGGQTDDFFVTEHEFILVYRKSSEFKWIDETIPASAIAYRSEDENGKYKTIKLAKWGSSPHKEDRPTMYFSITNPDGKKTYPIAPDGLPGRWRVGKKRMSLLEENELIEWKKDDDGKWNAYEKVYYDPENDVDVIKYRSIMYETAQTGDATKLLTQVFGQKDIFDNPKPIEILQELISHCKSEIVLDFFAGSGSFLHAVLKQNVEDGINRQCILVQSPEKTYKITNNEKIPFKTTKKAFQAGFEEISQITYERAKRVINGYTYKEKDYKGLGSSLKYYRTSFVGNNEAINANDTDRIELAKKAGALLSISENTLYELKSSEYYQIFSNESNKITGVYFTGNTDGLREFCEELEAIRDKSRLNRISAYFYTTGNGDEFENEFDSLRNIRIKTIPEPILKIYRALNI